MAKQIKAIDPDTVETPKPWERETCHFSEVPAVIKFWYGRTFKADTIYSWIRKGKKNKAGKKIGLAAHKMGGLLYVRIDHLRNFLEAT